LDRPALRRCIAIEPKVFAGSYWSRRPLLSTAADLSGSFADLFGTAAVDELISRRGLRTPFLRMAKKGRIVDPGHYTGPAGVGAEISDQAIDERVMALFADGATLVLQGLHRLWPPLIDLAGALSTELGHPVQINAYVTPPSNRGFDPHYDTHDVFVLQVAGQKRWRIHPPVLADPLRSMPWSERAGEVAAAAGGEPLIDAVLSPGDALYLPRGYLHAAEALGGVSVHLTIGVHVLTRYALVETLLRLAADDDALRRSLPLGIDAADPDDLAPVLTETVQLLRGNLDRIAAGMADGQDAAALSAVAADLRRRIWPANRPGPIGPLEQAAALTGLDHDTRLLPREHLRYRLEPADGERVTIRYPDRWLRFPVAAEPALRALLAGDVSRVGDLPGLDPDEQLVVARRLLREALVVPAAPRLAR
jgi:ribosomal protein L16 Arg81 hydroxylase